MELSTIVFYVFTIFTVGSAVLVVTTRNIVHAAFSLMVTLFGIAGFYVFLQADFLAATQVVVYVGGILVLILFGVMMTSGKLEMNLQMERGQITAGAVVSLVLLAVLLTVIFKTEWKILPLEPSYGTTSQIGKLLMQQEFLLPFEVASVLLLVALIGAVVISRKEIKE